MKKTEFESPYRHYKLETILTPIYSTFVGVDNEIDSKNKDQSTRVSMFARSTTVSSSFGYNLYNMPIVKNFIKKDYDLLNIVHTLSRPYFFGIGIHCKFSCNDGFAKDEINI